MADSTLPAPPATEVDLDGIRKRVEAASAAPWIYDPSASPTTRTRKLSGANTHFAPSLTKQSKSALPAPIHKRTTGREPA